MDAEALYRRLAVSLQQAACSFEGLRALRAQRGGEFPSLLAEAEARGGLTTSEIQAWRDARLRAFVAHCAATVPYYRRWFRHNKIAPEDIRGLDDLHLLPVLTKADVQNNVAEFTSEAVPKRRRVPVHTSGTTGAGLRFATTRRAVREQFAIWWRYRHWHGLRRGTWCDYFGGRTVVSPSQTKPPFWRYDLPGRRILFSGYHMSPDHLPAYVDELRRRRPPWLHGYPSSLALLAAHMAERGADLGYEVRWITVGSENLLAQQATVIARAFGTQPIQHYGMAEAAANASQCEHGRLHVDEDFAPVELLPINGVEGACRIVGTNVSNPATPLLRYDMGDTATLSDAACACDRPGRTIASVDGRQEDYVVLANGARVGRLDHIFKDIVEVREAQIVQNRAGELTVRVVRGHGYDDAVARRIRREFVDRLGRSTTVELEYSPALPRTSAAKLRFVESTLEQTRLGRTTPDGRLA